MSFSVVCACLYLCHPRANCTTPTNRQTYPPVMMMMGQRRRNASVHYQRSAAHNVTVDLDWRCITLHHTLWSICARAKRACDGSSNTYTHPNCALAAPPYTRLARTLTCRLRRQSTATLLRQAFQSAPLKCVCVRIS